MLLQKVHPSIVRSIRQVSLMRDWLRARGRDALPDILDFVPDNRAGDAADIIMIEVVRQDERVSYFCQSAGERVQQLFDQEMAGRLLEDCLDPPMAKAARPIWDASIAHQLPVYCIIPLADPKGCPVTVEQIFLPYGRARKGPDFLVGVLHAWSTEGRFISHGLLRNVTKVPLHWAVVVDPALKVAEPAAEGDSASEIVFDESAPSIPGRLDASIKGI